MPDPICIGLARSEPDNSCTLACFWTGSIWPKPDTISQNYTGSKLVLHNIIWNVCGRMEPSLKVGNWQQAGCILPETRPDDSCTPACFQTRCIWPSRSDPSQFCTIWSMPSLEKQSWNGCRKTDPAYILSGLIMAACWLQLAITKMLLDRIWHVYWAAWRFSLKKELDKLNFFSITCQISGILVKL